MLHPAIRLELSIGRERPAAVGYDVVQALAGVEVVCNDRDRDGFQLTFRVGRAGQAAGDYPLLNFQDSLLDPQKRVIIRVYLGTTPSILIDGIITQHQLVPSNKPGESTLTITGEDISLLLDLEDRNRTHTGQSDSTIVKTILSAYRKYGINADVPTETEDQPTEQQRVPTQQGTDLAFLRQLAERNGYIFLVEPGQQVGDVRAYWGPDEHQEQPQPPLLMNMGPLTNVDQPINFTFNSLGPVKARANTFRGVKDLPTPSGPQLSARPAAPIRQVLLRDTAHLSPAQLQARGAAAVEEAGQALTGSGQMDTVRYGNILRVRKLVSIAGVGKSYDGVYYVKQVSHRIHQGTYTQAFSITREGRGAVDAASSR